MALKIKVCGMKQSPNIQALAKIAPDYMGFIFYKKSKRYAPSALSPETVKKLPEDIKTVGVFVKDDWQTVWQTAQSYALDFVQLHGGESPEFCRKLTEKGLKVIKVFSINSGFDFEKTRPFQACAKFFLFDTQTPQYGGSGKKFDWQLLQNYPNQLPVFLSGGIDLPDAQGILNIKDLNIHAIDINSRFETAPGVKNIEKIKQFFHAIRQKAS